MDEEDRKKFVFTSELEQLYKLIALGFNQDKSYLEALRGALPLSFLSYHERYNMQDFISAPPSPRPEEEEEEGQRVKTDEGREDVDYGFYSDGGGGFDQD